MRSVAVGHLVVAAGIVLFWVGFHTELLFPVEVLRERILHFEGYYAWESSFTVPDLLTALVMVIGARGLLRDPASLLHRHLLMAASGALVFLGVLDFTYDARHGMYALGHWFSYVLLEIGVVLPLFGVASVWALHREPGQG
jgi:hypothetical protein